MHASLSSVNHIRPHSFLHTTGTHTYTMVKMNETIMGRFQCPSYLIRANVLILFIMTLSCVIQQPNAALNDAVTVTSTPNPTTVTIHQQHQTGHGEKMSTFNNYSRMKSGSGSSEGSNNNNNNNNNNNSNDNNKNRFSGIRQILYHRPTDQWYVNETLRWHKINMISNLFKHRVKRKVKQSQLPKSNDSNSSVGGGSTQPLKSNVSITTSNARIYEHNINTNTIDFSNNQQIHDILTFVHLNMLLNQRSIHNTSTSNGGGDGDDDDDNLALNFSHNSIKQIDANLLASGSFERPHQRRRRRVVRRLDLSYNKIEIFNIESVSGNNNSHQIEWLSVSNNALKSFNGENLKHLKYLDLSCNNMGNASQIRMSATNTTNDSSLLEYVNLSGNRLNQWQVGRAVEKLIKLKVMNLAYNRLERIHNDMFGNLVDIEALDLSHNRIALIESGSFSALSKLQYLDLSYNFIDAISLRAFQPIPNLRKLSIAFNWRLGDALQGFISSWSLKHLDMSGTGLCEIPNALTQSVRTLNISYNNFGVIRCGDLDSYPLLQHLDLSSSHIVDIEEDALGRLDMLITLHLNNNNIAHVPSSLPVNLIQLFLQNNRIADIQSSTFSHLVNLEVVSLSGNQLTYMPSLPLPRLMVLDLRATGLRRLSPSIIKMSPKLRIVYLDGNPIKCNELLGVAEWATPCRTDDFTEIGNFGEVTATAAAVNAVDRMESSKMWKTCDCSACQPPALVDSIDQSKLHCNNKNTTNSKRIRFTKMPLSIGGSSFLTNGNPLSNDTRQPNLTSTTNDGNNAQHHHDESKSETVVNRQRLKPMNGFRLHNNSTAYSIGAAKQQRSTDSSFTAIDAIIVQTQSPNTITTTTTSPTSNSSSNNENLNVTNPRLSPLSIITNDVSASVAMTNVNRPDAADIESNSSEMVKMHENSKSDAQLSDAAVVVNQGTTSGWEATLQQSFASPLPLNPNKNAKTNEFTLNGNALMDEKLTNKPTQKTSNDDAVHSDLQRMRLIFNYQTSTSNVNKQRNHIEIDAHHREPTNEMPISTNNNKLESLIAAVEFTVPTTKTTAMAPSTQTIEGDNSKMSSVNNNNNNNKNSHRINSQQHQTYLEHNPSDHKVNKSQANWNINKAISTPNDNLQQDRNLLPALFDKGDAADDDDDVGSSKLLESSSHINEINKNQMAAGNQLNEIRTSNIDANALDTILVNTPRENPVKVESDDQQTIRTLPPTAAAAATIKKAKKMRLAQINAMKNKSNTIANTTNQSNITIDKGLNKRIINSNSSTETDGIVINDVMKNGQQISARKGHGSRATGKIATETENSETSVSANGAAVALIDVHGASANIGSAQMSIDSSIPSESNHIRGNDSDTMAEKTDNSNNSSSSSDSSDGGVDGRAMADKNGSSFEIQAENKVVDDNNDGNQQQKDEQMQQIKHTMTTKTTSPPTTVAVAAQAATVSTVDRAAAETSAKGNPLIGRISQNVSIIDNEHRFQWHININHSMHGQKAFESGTSTKLQSSSTTSTSNDERARKTAAAEAAHTQDRYDNGVGGTASNGDNSNNSRRKSDDANGSGSRNSSSTDDNASDNSAVHGISEQWNDKRVTSGHSGLFVIIGIGIGVFVTLNFVHMYRLHKRRQYNRERSNGTASAAAAASIATATERRNRPAENNLLIGMQMEMFNTAHYSDTPIDLW